MSVFSPRYKKAVTALLNAYQSGQLGHDHQGGSAITHLLGGNHDWLTVINPAQGSIDHEQQQSDPHQFAKSMEAIIAADFSVEEIIQLEARFEGRNYSPSGQWLSTLDDDNDPEGNLGLSAVMQWLEAIEFSITENAEIPTFQLAG
jgi:hypothetical protein